MDFCTLKPNFRRDGGSLTSNAIFGCKSGSKVNKNPEIRCHSQNIRRKFGSVTVNKSNTIDTDVRHKLAQTKYHRALIWGSENVP